MDTSEHVLDQRAKGADGTSSLVGSVPHADSNEVSLATILLLILFHHLDLAGDVREVLGDFTLSSLSDDLTRFNLHLDYSRLNSSNSYCQQEPTATLRSTIASFCLYLLY